MIQLIMGVAFLGMALYGYHQLKSDIEKTIGSLEGAPIGKTFVTGGCYIAYSTTKDTPLGDLAGLATAGLGAYTGYEWYKWYKKKQSAKTPEGSNTEAYNSATEGVTQRPFIYWLWTTETARMKWSDEYKTIVASPNYAVKSEILGHGFDKDPKLGYNENHYKVYEDESGKRHVKIELEYYNEAGCTGGIHVHYPFKDGAKEIVGGDLWVNDRWGLSAVSPSNLNYGVFVDDATGWAFVEIYGLTSGQTVTLDFVGISEDKPDNISLGFRTWTMATEGCTITCPNYTGRYRTPKEGECNDLCQGGQSYENLIKCPAYYVSFADLGWP